MTDIRKLLYYSVFWQIFSPNSLHRFPIISIFVCKSYARIFAYRPSREPSKTADYVQVFKGRHFGAVGAGRTQGEEKRLVPREDTSHTQPQAEILFHGTGAVKGGLGEPCGKQEPQAHGGTLEHREQLLNHQGAGRGTRRTWRFRFRPAECPAGQMLHRDGERRDKGKNRGTEAQRAGGHIPQLSCTADGGGGVRRERHSVFCRHGGLAEPLRKILDGPKEKQVHAQRLFQDAQGDNEPGKGGRHNKGGALPVRQEQVRDTLSRGQEAGTHAGTDKEARHLYRREGGNRTLPGHVVLLLPLQRHQLPGHALSYLREHRGR